MIYVLARVTDGTKVLAYMCTNVSVEEVSRASGAVNPNFKMVPPQELKDALSMTRKEMEDKGYKSAVASIYNKRNIVNMQLVNGEIQAEVSGGFPTLLAQTRDVAPHNPRGIILAEYTDLRGNVLGYCLALFNSKTNLFDLGRARVNALALQMESAQQAGYNMISNATLSVDEETGVQRIVRTGTGYETFKIISQATTTKAEQSGLTKIVSGGEKKRLGKTATTIINNVSESAGEVTGNVDLFRSLTPEQAKFLQLYYMTYTKQVFECLRKTSRLDISSEKLAKLDMYRVDSDIVWEYEGMEIGSHIGSFTCALGHLLKRAHIAKANNLLDANGEPAVLIFGLTCLSDFFNLNSEDLPVLSKAERIMVDEISYITELFNNKEVEVGWKNVELFKHFVVQLARKQYNETATSLEYLVGKNFADLLLGFVKLGIPFPKSATELFLTNATYSVGNIDSYRNILRTYVTRKVTDDRSVTEAINRRRIFEQYLGAGVYKVFKTICKKADNVTDFILDAKLQGVYGWNPENKSSGFRGMHDRSAKGLYYTCEGTMIQQFGVGKFTPDEFINLKKLLSAEYLIFNEYEYLRDSFRDSYYGYAQTLLTPMFEQAGFVAPDDSQLAHAITAVLVNSNNYYATLIDAYEGEHGKIKLYLGSNLTYKVNKICVENSLRDSANKLLNLTLSQKEKMQKLKVLLDKEASKPTSLSRAETQAFLLKLRRNEHSSGVLKDQVLSLNSLLYSKDLDDIRISFTWGVFTVVRNEDATIGYKVKFIDDYCTDATDLDSVVSGKVTSVKLVRPIFDTVGDTIMLSDKTMQGNKAVAKFQWVKKDNILVTLNVGNGKEYSFTVFKAEITAQKILKELRKSHFKDTTLGRVDLRSGIVKYKTTKTLSGAVANGIIDDVTSDSTLVVNFKNFEVRTYINDITEMERGSGIFKVKFLVIVVNKKGKEIHRADSIIRIVKLSAIEGINLEQAYNGMVSLSLNFTLPIWSLVPKPSGIVFNTNGTSDFFTLPDECIVRELDKAVKQASSASKGKATDKPSTKAKTKREEEEDKIVVCPPVYIRGRMPDVIDKTDVYHALLYCYDYDDKVTKYTPDTDMLLSRATPYSELPYGSKALLQRDIAFHVSVYGVDLSGFKLPFEINTFITPENNPDFFNELKDAYSFTVDNRKGIEDEVIFALNVVESILRYNRMTTKQRKYADVVMEHYKQAIGQA